MEKVHIITNKEIYTKENGKMEKDKEQEYFITMMVINVKVIGREM